jgi:hypothetical protein
MTAFTRIPLSSGLVLKSYEHGWIVAEERTYATGAKVGQTYDHEPKYYAGIYSALQGAQEAALLRSEATTLEALHEALRRFQTGLGELFEVRVTAKVGR